MRRIGLAGLAVAWAFSTAVVSAAEFGEIDLSVYALGSWPLDQTVTNQGSPVPASIKQGYGAGIKVGLFPKAFDRILGIELESNGHSGSLSFPNPTNGGTARSNMVILNSMLNLIVRYPGDVMRPYVGIGGGWSSSALLDPNIVGRNDKDFDSAHTLGYQYIAGLQVIVSPKLFAFSEYRYFSANYHWDSLAVDFRAHYGLIGVGLRF